MKKHFLGVGVNFKSSNPYQALRGCENDIFHWESVLKSLYGFEADKCKKIFTSAATKEWILHEFESFIKKLKDDDLGVFVYSGHGTTKKSKGPNEDQDQGFTCFDYSIMDWEIRAYLNNKQRSKKAKIVLIFDCCYSGTITDSIFPPVPPLLKFTESSSHTLKYLELKDEEYENLTRLKESFIKNKKSEFINFDHYPIDSEEAIEYYQNELLISASGDNRLAAEDFIHYQTWIGVLTRFLITSITQNPSRNYYDLLEETRDLIERAGYRQTPRLTGSEAFKLKNIFR